MKLMPYFFAVVLLISSGLMATETTPGKVTGGDIYSIPPWFKSSFMDFQEDSDEAREQGKHVMLFMHLDECTYCNKMLQENFIGGESKVLMESSFDVIGVNVRGDLEVTWIDGVTYSERELTDHLETIATPTIVFLDLDGNKVLQLNGYRDPQSFRYALDYVQSMHYRKQPFADYLLAQKKPVIYTFRTHPQITAATYLKDYDKPLAILFEDSYCVECGNFHEKTLNHPDVLDAMDAFLFVRLDASSDQLLVDIDGQLTTPAQWVKELGLTYRPALVLFNQGKEMVRADGQLYHHHLTERLRYVSEGYLKYDTMDEFKEDYRQTLLAQGKNVDFSE
jgi:thioredoxin-related protein